MHNRLIVSTILSALLASCGPGALTSVTPAGSPSQDALSADFAFRFAAMETGRQRIPDLHRIKSAWIDKRTCGRRVIYSSDLTTNTIDIFPQKSIDEGPCGQLTLKRPPLTAPQGLFVDPSGDLWIANSFQHEIVELAPLSNKVLRKLYDTLGEPVSVVVDSISGSVYVGNLVGTNNGPGGVIAFDAGSNVPTRQLSDPHLVGAFFVTIDSAANVYATVSVSQYSNNYGQVHEWVGGTGDAVDLGISLSFPGGIETTSTGALLICDQGIPACGEVEPGTQTLTNEFATSSRDPVNASLSAAENTVFTEDFDEDIIYAWRYPGPDSHPRYKKTVGIPNSLFVAAFPAPPIGKPFSPSEAELRRSVYTSR